MMNKTLLTLALLAFSNNSFAIKDGSPVNASNYPSLVEMNCTGTIIAGKWVLTAAHCTRDSAGGLRPVNLVGSTDNNRAVETLTQINHPHWESEGVDISLWGLRHHPDIDKIEFLSMTPVVEGDEIKIFGFGQTRQQLNSALQTAQKLPLAPNDINLLDIGKGDTLSGDSGGPYIKSNTLIGIHNSGNAWANGASGTRLTYARDFILNTINGWHYPTLATTATTGGKVTVEVQSLHMQSFVDNATYSGDVTITGGTCSGATVEPFDTCTYEIESPNGYEGKVTLDDGQVITVNKGRKKPASPAQPAPSEGGSSGGSFGFLSLLGLLVMSRLRRA